jgi:hypothetical protein
MKLEIYNSSNELKDSFNITFLKGEAISLSYGKVGILGFVEELDTLRDTLSLENEEKDLRKDIMEDLNLLPKQHSADDVIYILTKYTNLYNDKESKQSDKEKLYNKIRILQNSLVPYLWNFYYGVIEDDSCYLFAYQESLFPLKAVIIPKKDMPQEIKEKFERLTMYGEYVRKSYLSTCDTDLSFKFRDEFGYFMMLSENTPSNKYIFLNDECTSRFISKCRFVYKQVRSLSQSIDYYKMLKCGNDIDKSIFLY